MSRVQHTEQIDAPVEAVFAFVDDYRNTTRYMKDLTRWEPADPRKTHGKGATFNVAMSAGPTKLESTVEMDGWTENREIAWHSTRGLKQKGAWTFKTTRGGTEATLSLEYEMPGGIAGRIIARGAEPAVRSNVQRSVKKLGELVSKQAAAAGRKAPSAAKATTANRAATNGRAPAKPATSRSSSTAGKRPPAKRS